MNFKVIGSLVVLLLILEVFDATTVWRLECGAETPDICKDKFKELFEKILRLGELYIVDYSCDYFENIIREARVPNEVAAKVIDAFNEGKRRAHENRFNKNEIEAVLDDMGRNLEKFPEIIMYIRRANIIKPEDDEKPWLPKTTHKILLNTLELFAGLRSQDYEQFPSWRDYENQFKDLSSHDAKDLRQYHQELRNTMIGFASFLGVSQIELSHVLLNARG